MAQSGPSLQSCLEQITEQEQNLTELRQKKGPFDRAVRALTTNIRESYETIILENLPSSELIEQQLWRLHYSFIEEFRARLGKLKAASMVAENAVPHKKKASEKQKFERVGGQYKCFLDEATGFYHGLIAKLGAKHGLSGKLTSPSNRAEISSSNERFRRGQCICHRCYVYLGDLARYKELHLVVEGRTADYYVAANYYRQASALWPAGGNPHNQLGVVSTYAGDNLQALYHYLYSLAVHSPFSTARENAKMLFDKNQAHNSQLSNSPEDDIAIDIQLAQAFESHKSSTESHKECPLARLQRRFRVHFITLLGLFFNKSGLEELSGLSTPVLREAQMLLSQDNMLTTSSFTLEKSNHFKNQAFSVMQLVVLLILSIHNVGSKRDRDSRSSNGSENMSPYMMQAVTFSFQFMTVVLQHCTRAEEPCCSHLFPAVVVFCNWLSSYPDLCQQIQGDEECEKFGKEASTLLSKCMQQVGMAKNHDNDSIAYSEKENHHGTETVLWEDKELCGLIPLLYFEPLKSKGGAAESACGVRVERLMKALMFLSSVLKLDSSELDAIAAVCKSPSGWASVRASPSERIKCTQSSGGSVRTGSMELKTQPGPSNLQRRFELSLSSHCRKEDRLFLKTRDRKSATAVPSKPASRLSDVEGSNLQHKTITEVELRACNFPAETALQQPESELCNNNREDPVRNNTDPVRNNTDPKDDSTRSVCSVGRGALSLVDWVIAPGGGDDNVVFASSASKKRSRSRPGLRGGSQQAQTHSSGEESYNPSLSFMAVCRTPPLAPLPVFGNAEVAKEQQNDTTDARASIQGCAQDPIVLESPNMQKSPIVLESPNMQKDPIVLESPNVQKDPIVLESPNMQKDPIVLESPNMQKDANRVEEELDTSNSRKRKYPSHEPSKDYEAAVEGAAEIEPGNQNPPTSMEEVRPDTSNSRKRKHSSVEPSKDDEAQLELDTSNSRKRKYSSHESSKDNEAVEAVEIEPSNQNPSTTTNVKELHSLHNPSQVTFVPNSPGHDVASSHEINHSTDHNQNIDSLVEDGGAIDGGRGTKRKHEAIIPPQAKSTVPGGASRCPTCQAMTPPGEGNWVKPRSRKYRNVDVDAGRRHGWCRDCKEPHPSSVPCSDRRRDRLREWDFDEDYSWLDTYTHVVPQALTKLATAMRTTSFSFSDFGIFREVGASVNAASGT